MTIRADNGYGERIDVAALKRDEQIIVHTGILKGEAVPVVLSSLAEMEELGVDWCEYVDLSVSWTDDGGAPTSWTCPDCGGTTFNGVHRNYVSRKLRRSLFTAPAPGSPQA